MRSIAGGRGVFMLVQRLGLGVYQSFGDRDEIRLASW